MCTPIGLFRVRDLIEKLKECDSNAMVVLASDAEGNNYSPLSHNDSGKYIPYKKDRWWRGEVCDMTDDFEGENCVVLYPLC